MRGWIVVVLALAVAGCTQYRWTKPGATPEMFEHDKYACQKDTLARVPPLAQQGPPVFVTPRWCWRDPYCGNWVPGSIVDINERLRNELYNSCLRAGGWDLIEVK